MRYAYSCWSFEYLISLSVVDIKQKCGDFQACKLVSCTNRLSSDVFKRFTSVKPNSFILTAIKALNKRINCWLWNFPDYTRLCIVVV